MTTEIDARVTEAQWQRTVLEGFRACGWVTFADRVAWRSDAGYPDITAIHAGQRRAIWVELKTETGKLTAAQERWRDDLLAAGQEWFCFKPSDWPAAEAVMRGARATTAGGAA